MTAHKPHQTPTEPTQLAVFESRVIVITDPRGQLITTDDSQRELAEVVINNMLRPITIEQLAKLCGHTTSKFKRKFKLYFGTSPHKWITRQRLAHAKMLLQSSTLSIKEVTFACGFVTASHFIRLFKAQYGITPAALRSAAAATHHSHASSYLSRCSINPTASPSAAPSNTPSEAQSSPDEGLKNRGFIYK